MNQETEAPGQVPEQTSPAVQNTNSNVPLTTTGAATSPTNNNKKLLGIIAAAVLAVLVVVMAWLFVFSPDAQAKKTSTAYMKATTKGDVEKLVKLTDSEGDADTKKFLEQSSASVKGDFSLKEKANKDNKWYFLYSLTNDTNKEGRTTIEKKDGKWIVTSFVYGKGNLALIPRDSSSQPDTSTPAPAPSNNVAACLSDSDVAVFNGATPQDEGYGTDFEEQGYRTYVGDTYFFEPDSIVYTYPDQSAEMSDKLKTFYETNKNKEFTIRLSGKVKESSSSAAGVRLARERSEKVRSDLVAKGIPSDRIVIDEAQPNSATYDEGSERNVDLSIRKKIPCTAPSSGAAR